MHGNTWPESYVAMVLCMCVCVMRCGYDPPITLGRLAKHDDGPGNVGFHYDPIVYLPTQFEFNPQNCVCVVVYM